MHPSEQNDKYVIQRSLACHSDLVEWIRRKVSSEQSHVVTAVRTVLSCNNWLVLYFLSLYGSCAKKPPVGGQ